MAKALALTPDTLAAPQITPKAATPARTATTAAAKTAAAQPAADQKGAQVPLQVRIPRDDARAIKVAAAQSDQTISEFMLACFHAYMKGSKHA